MPRLSEVERLFTSDSAGGRTKSSAKRKYHLQSDLTLASTRTKSRKVEDAASALLSVASIAREEGKHETSVSVNPPSHREDTAECSDTADSVPVVDSKNEVCGNRLIDVKKLDDVVRNNFCCKHCIDKSVKNYLHDFLQFADQEIKKTQEKARKIKTFKQKVNFYEANMKLPSQIYDQYNGQLNSQRKGGTRTDMVAVPVSMKYLRTIGLATELQFQCQCRKHFKNRGTRPHVSTVKADKVDIQEKATHQNFIVNNLAVSAIHHIGCGPYHLEQILAWLNHPWKSIAYCFKKTAERLGEIKTKVAKMSVTAAQDIEKRETIKNTTTPQVDHRGRTGVAGSLDMHWPQRGSGRSYNSDSGASYLIGVHSKLIIGTCVFCKSCRICLEHLKK